MRPPELADYRDASVAAHAEAAHGAACAQPTQLYGCQPLAGTPGHSLNTLSYTRSRDQDTKIGDQPQKQAQQSMHRCQQVPMAQGGSALQLGQMGRRSGAAVLCRLHARPIEVAKAGSGATRQKNWCPMTNVNSKIKCGNGTGMPACTTHPACSPADLVSKNMSASHSMLMSRRSG